MRRNILMLLAVTAIATGVAAGGNKEAAQKHAAYKAAAAQLTPGTAAADVIASMGTPYERMIRRANAGRREEMWIYPTGQQTAVSLLFANGSLEKISEMQKSYSYVADAKLSEREKERIAKLESLEFGISSSAVKARLEPDLRTVYSTSAPASEGWYYFTGNTMTIVMFRDDQLDAIVQRRVTKQQISAFRTSDATPRPGAGMDPTNPGIPGAPSKRD